MTVFFQAVLLGLVEGLTEFIPVSSTAHLIIVGHLIGFVGEKAKTFEIFIQLGAILAVVVVYKDRFLGLMPLRKGGAKNSFSGGRGLMLLALTTLPALCVGALSHTYVKQRLFHVLPVALGLALGGGIMLWVERREWASPRVGLHTLRFQDALAIGLFQSLAIWPGVSRSGATIVGAMLIGVERKTAAEYSFIAAVPVLFAGALFDLWKTYSLLALSDGLIFLIGFVISFVAARMTIRIFIALLSRVTLRPFGWYRIGVACLIFALFSR